MSFRSLSLPCHCHVGVVLWLASPVSMTLMVAAIRMVSFQVPGRVELRQLGRDQRAQIGKNEVDMNLQQLIQTPSTRREFLARSGTGFGALGLAGLLNDGKRAIADSSSTAGQSPMLSKPAQFPGKAKQVIHIFFSTGGLRMSIPSTRNPRSPNTPGRFCQLPTYQPNAKPGPPWPRRSSFPATVSRESKSVSSSTTPLSIWMTSA